MLANDDGGLNKDTFRTALAFFDQKAGYESIHAMAKSRDLSDHLFDVFDSDGNGEIDLNEFTVGLLSLVTGSKRDKVRSLFQLCDLDASGEIDHNEFYQLLHFLHVELPKVREVKRPRPLFLSHTTARCRPGTPYTSMQATRPAASSKCPKRSCIKWRARSCKSWTSTATAKYRSMS